jgi:hypothetical protein
MTPLKITDPILPAHVKATLKRLMELGVASQGSHQLSEQTLRINGVEVEHLQDLLLTALPQIGTDGEAGYRPATAIASEIEDYDDGRVVLTLAVDLAS